MLSVMCMFLYVIMYFLHADTIYYRNGLNYIPSALPRGAQFKNDLIIIQNYDFFPFPPEKVIRSPMKQHQKKFFPKGHE